MTKPSKRKHLFVAPKVQSALAVRLALHWVLFAVILSVVSITFKWFTDPFQSAGGLFSGFLRDQWPVLFTLVLLLPAFLYDSLKLSNRFAGPIVRFRKTIQSIAETGTASRLKFRKGDFWHELASDFNSMLDKLEEDRSNQAPVANSDADSRERVTAN